MSSDIPVAPAAAPSLLPQRPLGQTGTAVTLFGLGGEGVLRTYDRAAEAVRVIHRALEHGVTYCEAATPKFEVKRPGTLGHSNDCMAVPPKGLLCLKLCRCCCYYLVSWHSPPRVAWW